MKKITVGLIQMHATASPKENLAGAQKKVAQAAKQGAQIICPQELFKSPYFPQSKNKKYFELAEIIPGPITDVFCALAKQLKIVVIVPVFEKTEEGTYYNTAVVIDADGEMLGTYRKTHLPNDPYFYEQFYFSPGPPNSAARPVDKALLGRTSLRFVAGQRDGWPAKNV